MEESKSSMMRSEHLRAWRFHKQGLERTTKLSAAQALERSGWARSVGGANPYLTIFSRTGLSREAIDRALEKQEIHELPCARGCTYVVPKAHYALALKVGQPTGDPQDVATSKKFLGVTEKEIVKLEDEICKALKKGSMEPRELKTAIGNASRSLGDEGKKRGVTTTLPLALGRLQNNGRIRRISTDGRLDNQRYRYALWDPSPLSSYKLDREQAFVELAKLYFKWIGPASLANFQWFSGLGVASTKAAVSALDLIPIEEGSDLLILKEDLKEFKAFVPPKNEQIALVGSIDGLVHLRRNVRDHVDDKDQSQKMKGDKALYAVGDVVDLTNHGIFDRGRLIGLWEFDSDRGEIVWMTFGKATPAVKKAVIEMERFVQEDLGDARSFSLDSPASRKPKIEFLRKSSS